MAMVASSFRGAVRLQCKCDTAKVFLDGKPPANIGPAGLEWTGVGAGLHELAVEDTRKVLETGSAPALNVFLKTDRNTGVLVISTGEDDATVYLNNKAYARQTQKGGCASPICPSRPTRCGFPSRALRRPPSSECRSARAGRAGWISSCGP